jgi:hypothetical protein
VLFSSKVLNLNNFTEIKVKKYLKKYLKKNIEKKIKHIVMISDTAYF